MAALNPSTARSMFWALLESGGLSVASVLTALVVARMIGPDGYGVAALALGIVLILNLAVESFFHDAIVQRSQIDPEHVDTALWTSTGVGVVLVALVWLLAPQLSRAFNMPQLGAFTRWASLSLLLSGAAGVLAARYRREMAFKPLAMRTLAGRLLGAAAAIGLAIAGFGAWSLIVQHLVAVVLGTAWLWSASSQKPRLRWSRARLGELAHFAISSFVVQAVLTAHVRIFAALVGYFLGPTALGYFSLATKLVEMLWFMLMSAVLNVTLVLFSRMQHDRAKLRWAFGEATQLTAATVLPVFAGLAVCADLVVELLLGARWLPIVPIIQLLCLSSMVATLRYFAPIIYRAVGRPTVHLLAASAGMLFALVGQPLFGQDDLMITAAIWTAAAFINLPVSLLVVRRLIGLGVRAQFRGTWIPLAVAAAMAGALIGLRIWGIDGWPPAAGLAVMVLFGIACYGAGLMLLAPKLAGRLWELARQLGHKSSPDPGR